MSLIKLENGSIINKNHIVNIDPITWEDIRLQSNPEKASNIVKGLRLKPSEHGLRDNGYVGDREFKWNVVNFGLTHWGYMSDKDVCKLVGYRITMSNEKMYYCTPESPEFAEILSEFQK